MNQNFSVNHVINSLESSELAGLASSAQNLVMSAAALKGKLDIYEAATMMREIAETIMGESSNLLLDYVQSLSFVESSKHDDFDFKLTVA